MKNELKEIYDRATNTYEKVLTELFKEYVNEDEKGTAADEVKIVYLTGKLDAIEEISQILVEYLTENN